MWQDSLENQELSVDLLVVLAEEGGGGADPGGGERKFGGHAVNFELAA